MSKILLLDFEAADKDQLVSHNFDAELRTTGWKAGGGNDLSIPEESEVIFYQIDASGTDEQSALHADIHEHLAARVRNGARIVCFLGVGKLFQLNNIVGSLPDFELQSDVRAEAITFNPKALFHVPFERFRHSIQKAWKLLPEAFADGTWEKDTPANGRIEVLAKSSEGFPVAALLRNGAGSVLLLPSFGDKNAEIVEYILKDKAFFADEVPDKEGNFSWIEQEDYVFPELRALLVKKDEETRRHQLAMTEIEAEIKEMKSGGQEEFHKLLKAEGPDLVKAVVKALGYLGFGKVVDVAKYWKNVIRDKEENIWLIDVNGQPIEVSLRQDPMTLVLVRGNKNWATDEDCSLLQKYKGRRMQEFDNTKMKSLLVGNYFCTTDPKSRSNPFSAVQIEEAQKDGNGLLTTYELFKAIKAEKEKKVTKDVVRAQLRDKTGLVTFEY
jgi:hypothetical protein